MPNTLLVLIVATLPFAAQRDMERQIVSSWIENVRHHEPGTIDGPLRDAASQPAYTFDVVCRRLESALSAIKDVTERNDVRRRGALLHTDIAVLLPERAAALSYKDLRVTLMAESRSQAKPTRRDAALVFSTDGEYLASGTEHAHWWMAGYLLRGIQPHAKEDPFVAAWNRAITAYFEWRKQYGSADHHLSSAFVVLPADPVLLFYAGALHEAYASAGIQSVPFTRPSSVRQVNVWSAPEEWHQAETYFRDSVKLGGPEEARLRLARVRGQLGNHADAASMLRDVMPKLRDPRLRYLGHLFLGTEEGALGRVDESRQSFERAARIEPTAQSPLLGLAEMYRRTGNLTAAQETLRRVAALPEDPRRRQDPYLDYFRSFAFDADEQLAAVRAMVKQSR